MSSVGCVKQTAVDLARDVFEFILEELDRGSTCPCSLAASLGVREKDLFPFLAELLAREWVMILIDDDYIGNHKTAPYYASEQLKESLKRTRIQHGALANGFSDQDLLIQRTKLWYGFFRDRKCESALNCPSYYLKITNLGAKRLDSLRP